MFLFFLVFRLIFYYILENYEQGVRRMNKAFSNTVVLSSAVEDKDSSECESDPKHLSGNELENSLKNIPATFKNQPPSLFHGSFFN